MKGCNSLRTVLAVIIYSIHFHLEMTVGHIKTRRYPIVVQNKLFGTIYILQSMGVREEKRYISIIFFALRTEIQKNKGTQNKTYIF